MKDYSKEIMQVVRENLKESDMKLVACDEENGHLAFVMHFPGQVSCVRFIINVGKDEYIVNAIAPIAPDARDPAALAMMSEFLSRVNFGLKNGNFELDFQDGEVRYKCFVNCDGQLPCRNIVSDSIAAPAIMMKNYMPGLINVIFNGMEPRVAVDLCEEYKRQQAESARLMEFLRSKPSDAGSAQEDGVLPEGEGEDLVTYEEFLRMEDTPDERGPDTEETDETSDDPCAEESDA